jgi:hypothetical protein
MATVKIPLYKSAEKENYNLIGTEEPDRALVVNGVIEKIADVANLKNSLQRQDTYYVKSRYSYDYSTTGASNLEDSPYNGSFYWDETQAIYHTNGNGQLFKNVGGTLTRVGTHSISGTPRGYADAGGCKWAIWSNNTTKYLLFSGYDRTDSRHSSDEIYYMTTGEVVTKIDSGTDAQFPALIRPGIVVIDGYTFVPSTGNRIYNSDLNAPTAWTGDYISASRYGDDVVCIEKYLNYLVSFNEYSIEMFYNAGNASGSPLARLDEGAQTIGCNNAFSTAEINGALYFVARTRQNSFFVARFNGLNVEKVSNGYVDKLLNQATTDKQALSRFSQVWNMYGKEYYVLTLYSGRAGSGYEVLCFDPTNNNWTSFSKSDGTYVLQTSARNRVERTEGTGMGLTTSDYYDNLYLLTLPNSGVDDYTGGSNVPITLTAVTGTYNFGSNKNKFIRRVTLKTDNPGNNLTQAATLYYSADGGITFTSAGSINVTDDANNVEPTWFALGRYKTVTFKIELTYAHSNTRVTDLELEVDVGEYGM